MQYDHNKYHRRSVRLRGYDYSRPGAYFFTLCLENKDEWLFGNVKHGEMQSTEFGNIVWDEWRRTPDMRCEMVLDSFVVMPNHIHGIIWIVSGRGIRPDAPTMHAPIHKIPTLTVAEKHGPSKRSLGAFAAGFKSITTRRINEIRQTPRVPVWQRNYNEHIIHNEGELNRIRQYIAENPAKWERDKENPNRLL